MSRLKIGECFNDCLHDDWVTVEASLDAFQNCDCIGHFYEGCAVSRNFYVCLFLLTLGSGWLTETACLKSLFISFQTKASNSSFDRSLPQRRSHWPSHFQAYRPQHPLQEVPRGRVCRWCLVYPNGKLAVHAWKPELCRHWGFELASQSFPEWWSTGRNRVEVFSAMLSWWCWIRNAFIYVYWHLCALLYALRCIHENNSIKGHHRSSIQVIL